MYMCVDVNNILVASAGIAEAHALEWWLEIGLAAVVAVDASAGAAVGVALLEIRDGAGLDLSHDGQDDEDYHSGKILGDEHCLELGRQMGV